MAININGVVLDELMMKSMKMIPRDENEKIIVKVISWSDSLPSLYLTTWDKEKNSCYVCDSAPESWCYLSELPNLFGNKELLEYLGIK